MVHFRPAGSGGNNMDGMWQAMEQLRSGSRSAPAPAWPRRRARGRARAARRAADARLPDHPRDRGAQRRQLEAQRRLGLPDAAAARRRGSDQRRGVERPQDLLAHRAGREEAAGAEASAPWDAGGRDRQGPGFTALPKAGIELAQAAAQVGRTGTPEQVQQAVAVLDEARRRLYSILAQD